MTVFVYVDTSKQVGDPEHVKVFATHGVPAQTCFEENDPEGVAFEYQVFVSRIGRWLSVYWPPS